MIVVAIIGILAAVAIPAYMTYIQKARVTALVFPGLHSIQTNLGLYYATNLRFPMSAGTTAIMEEDGDLGYFATSYTTNYLKITISGRTKLAKLDAYVLTAQPVTAGNKITQWALGGNLALKLGLEQE